MCAGSEILTQEKDHDLDVVEIPITTRYDIDGGSTKNPVLHGVGVLNSSLGYYCFGRAQSRKPVIYQRGDRRGRRV